MTADDRIVLTGLRCHGHHGVYAEERRTGQDFVVDAVLHVDTRAAAGSDDVADTVDYGVLADRLAGVVAGEPFDLLETLAARLAETCLADPRVSAAEVTVHKPQAPIAREFADVAVRVARARAAAAPAPGAATAVVSLGANLGDRLGELRRGLALLAAHDRLRVAAVSAVYETAPVGGPEQGPYLNAVARLDTGLGPEDLLGVLHVVEAAAGRVRDVQWGPRTLDLDLVVVGGERRAGPALTLPHPRAHERAFVLVPWLDVDPDAVLPGHGRVATLAAAVADQQVERRPDLPLERPR